MPQKEKIDLSVVVPVYGCSGCLFELHKRLKKVLSTLTPRHEMVFVEDRGSDESWEILSRIAKKDKQVKAYRLSRNFGQHSAITAGLSHADGLWTVVMDCDLQDPPEEISRLYHKAKEGFDIVLMKRKNKKLPFFRKWAASLYFKLINLFTTEHLNGVYGSFSILHEKVRLSYLRFHDNDRHYLFILKWLGYKTTSLEYEHGDRFAGKSSYSLRALLTHGLNGIFFQTTILLHWIIYLGFWVSLCGWVSAFYFLYLYLFHSPPPGWTSLAILILIVSGFILISTGITGLYLGKVFEQVKSRPLYVVDQSIEKGKLNG
ncbi:MAG TPA: glycosyltransferase family 2 protein [bacterium]|jgi:glycosyltransferase involved in cell wall biosynthesis|nr:glycosyltransferase family 2 protein [bacterium]